MAGGVNMVVLVGRLGKDPEMRYTPGGAAVANVSLATSESWRDKATGEKQERTEWHRLVFFGKRAEVVGEYARKGTQLYVRGRLQTRKWQGKDGQDRFTTEVVVDDFQLMGGRPDGGGSPAQGAVPGRPAGRPAAQTEQQQEDFDDDIPF